MITINKENFSKRFFGNNFIKGNPVLTGESSIKIRGKNNILIFEAGVEINGSFQLYGDNALVKMGKNSRICGRFSISGFSILEIGRHVFMQAPSYFSVGRSDKITIGDYCLLSDIICYSTDWHSIHDCNGNIVNEPADVVIEDHVWLAREVFVTKGSRIGRGSVVGARSLVTGKIPNNCVAVGIPARVIREDISWSGGSIPAFKPDLTSFSNKSLKFSRRTLWKIAAFFRKIHLLSEKSFTDFCHHPTENLCQPGLTGKFLYLMAKKTETHTLKLLDAFKV